MLLGAALEPAFAEATRQALAELDAAAPRARSRRRGASCRTPARPKAAPSTPPTRSTACCRSSSTGRAASTSMDFVLRDMALVHEGPVKRFQDAVLAEMGLLP